MTDSPDTIVLIAAAGRGSRFGNADNKVFAELCGRPVWRHAVDSFTGHPAVRRIVMAVNDVDRPRFQLVIDHDALPIDLVIGGQQRSDSVAAMIQRVHQLLKQLHDNAAIGSRQTDQFLIAVHDAARPLLSRQDLDNVLAVARRTGAAFLGNPVTASLHRCRDGRCQAIDRTDLYAAATPQIFRWELFRHIHHWQSDASSDGQISTDDVAMVQQSGHDVSVVPGRSDNLKITYPEDLELAEAIMQRSKNDD